MLKWNQIVLLSVNKEHRAVNLLDRIEIVEVLCNDRAEKSSDDVSRNFLDGQISADKNDAAGIKFRS